MKPQTKNNIDSKSILSKNGISRTEFRTELLNLFYSSNVSFSVEDILRIFDNSVNKVTVYRSLESFEQKGLIHQVPDPNNLKRYSLCKADECREGSHNHNHGHFICHSCNQTFCLEEIISPDITCLKGFYVKELKLTAEGYCNSCYKN